MCGHNNRNMNSVKLIRTDSIAAHFSVRYDNVLRDSSDEDRASYASFRHNGLQRIQSWNLEGLVVKDAAATIYSPTILLTLKVLGKLNHD